MLIITGKTASGKDTIVNQLINRYGYKKLITYSTRPMREGEIQDKTYHFITEEDFLQKIKDGFFAEWKSYNTIESVWYYGSAKEDYGKADDNTVVILTPAGYKDICNNLGYSPKCIYVYANRATIKDRLLKRGDKREEAERRIAHDDEDFKGFDIIAYKIVYNNLNDDIVGVADKINRLYKE